MFLRESRHRRASGEVVVYLQLVESVWNAETKRSETRVIYNFGRSDDEATTSKLRELAKSILHRVSPEDLVADSGNWKLLDAWPFGDIYVLEQLWAQLALPAMLPQVAHDMVSKYVPAERSECPSSGRASRW